MLVNEVVNSKAIALAATNDASNDIPYLGLRWFPEAKKSGLDLKWIKGENDGGYKNKPLFQNPLKGISSQERWDKIFNIPSTNDDLLCSRM